MIPVADIGPAWPRDWFEHDIEEACETFPYASLAPILAKHCDSEIRNALHWPWIAFALANYARRQKRGRDSNELKPDDAGELLSSVAQLARKLDNTLRRLDEATDATLANGNVPKWTALARAQRHLIDAFADPDFRRLDDSSAARADFVHWRELLHAVASRADEANLNLSQDGSAKAGGGQRLLGLSALIALCGAVWLSLKGKAPSAEPSKIGGGSPPFVRFVVQLCESARLPAPTISQVKVALKSSKPKPLKARYQFKSTRGNVRLRRS